MADPKRLTAEALAAEDSANRRMAGCDGEVYDDVSSLRDDIAALEAEIQGWRIGREELLTLVSAAAAREQAAEALIAALQAALAECKEKSGTYIDLGKVPTEKRPPLVIGPP